MSQPPRSSPAIADPHSGFGIASVIAGGLALLCLAYSLASSGPHPDIEVVVAQRIARLAVVVLATIGLLLAIVGCLLPDRRLLFPRLGLGLNILILGWSVLDWMMM